MPDANHRRLIICLGLLGWLALCPIARCLPTQALTLAVDTSPPALCRSAVAAAEMARHVPDGFLAAIARVESGRTDPASGALAAWPWTVNAEGAGSFYATKAEALAAVRALQARGVRSIDVGCMQVNLMHHPEAFASLEQAFDPGANGAYAADFLVTLFHQTGSWPLAAAAYHSQTPTLGSAYQKRVLAEWAVPTDEQGGDTFRSTRSRNRSAKQAQLAAHQAAPSPGGQLQGTPPAPTANQAEAQADRPTGSIASVGRVPGLIAQVGQSAHAPVGSGRSLAAYRMMPTQLALRQPIRRF